MASPWRTYPYQHWRASQTRSLRSRSCNPKAGGPSSKGTEAGGEEDEARIEEDVGEEVGEEIATGDRVRGSPRQRERGHPSCEHCDRGRSQSRQLGMDRQRQVVFTRLTWALFKRARRSLGCLWPRRSALRHWRGTIVPFAGRPTAVVTPEWTVGRYSRISMIS